MKAYQVQHPGSINGLVVQEDQQLNLESHEVRVQVHAASLNFRGLLIVYGRYPVPGLLKNVVPMSDGAGEVIEVGAAVRRVKLGDRVAFNFQQRWIDGPISAQYMGSDLGGSINGLMAESASLNEEIVGVCSINRG